MSETIREAGKTLSRCSKQKAMTSFKNGKLICLKNQTIKSFHKNYLEWGEQAPDFKNYSGKWFSE